MIPYFRSILGVTGFFSLVACSGWSFEKDEQVNLSIASSPPASPSGAGYQSLEITTLNDLKFCEDSFAARFTRSLFNNGGVSVMSLMLDKVPISAFTYDKRTGTCTKETISYLRRGQPQRADIARDAEHSLVLAYIRQEQVSTFKTAVKLLADFSSFPAAGTVPKATLDAVSSNLDSALQSALSSSDMRTEKFQLPYEGNELLKVDASIDGRAYPLAKIRVLSQPSLISSPDAKETMTQHLLDPESINRQLENQRYISDRSLIPGNVATARSDCSYLSKRYSELLTASDMQILREHYLVANHANIGSPEMLEACRLPSSPEELKTSLRLAVENHSKNATANRGTRFMDGFNATADSSTTLRSLKWSFAPSGFAYKNIGELLDAGLQSPPACFQFSKQEPNTFYFTLEAHQKPLYFVAQLDQAYSRDEEKTGKRSTILSVGLTDNVMNAGRGEYYSLRGDCLGGQAVAERSVTDFHEVGMSP